MRESDLLELGKMIAAMREDLLSIEGDIDGGKLTEIEAKAAHMLEGLGQLARVLWVTVPQPAVWNGGERSRAISKLISSIEMSITQVYCLTQMLKRGPEYEKKLVETVARCAPRIRSTLDEIDPAIGPPRFLSLPDRA